VRRDSIRNMGVDHTWFNDNALVPNVDFKDPIHPRETDHDPTFGRQRSAAQSGTRSTRNKGDPVFCADTNYGLYLICGAREHDGIGQSAEIRKPIALVSLELVGSRDEAAQLTRTPTIVSIKGILQRIENGRIQHLQIIVSVIKWCGHPRSF